MYSAVFKSALQKFAKSQAVARFMSARNEFQFESQLPAIWSQCTEKLGPAQSLWDAAVRTHTHTHTGCMADGAMMIMMKRWREVGGGKAAALCTRKSLQMFGWRSNNTGWWLGGWGGGVAAINQADALGFCTHTCAGACWLHALTSAQTNTQGSRRNCGPEVSKWPQSYWPKIYSPAGGQSS